MDVRIYQLLEGARQARGLTVIIDVFRAFSLECYLFDRGVREILAVGDQATALRLREEHPEYVLIGERGGRKLPGFDYGNSPFQTKHAALSGKTVVHTTSAGTQGIANASEADEVITASLVNARSVAEYIRKKRPERVSVVCMGVGGVEEAPEDTLCGRYLRALLLGEPIDMEEELKRLRQTPSAAKFFLPQNQEVFPKEDYAMCVDVDRFRLVIGGEPLESDVFRMTLRQF